ncbi:GlxA family transcriptional regulator [Acidocella sp.]|uniref:GlxA family transcriptional regulator n=1 Tax=Acidocella sp. TaxID=50710 RepID=UPI0026285071|nr:GlxA family transcriptional regulator [Acidocella sp.]
MTRRIGILLYPDFQILDATGPIAAFEIAGRLAGGGYELSVLSVGGGLIVSSSGVALASMLGQDADMLDTLVVVGGQGSSQAMHCPKTRAFLQAQSQTARRLSSVCSGAFLLAAAGLLDGRRATTHWRRAEELARLFPRVAVEPDAIHIRDGTVWTSAGITAGIDLALTLIAEDWGAPIAKRVAQEMVVYYRRPGGQSQFSALLDMGGGDRRFADLLGWMRGHLGTRLTIETMAAQVAMSPRHFSRAFTSSVGMSPARAVERLRLEAARERIEHSSAPIEVIAAAVGFHDPERMRRAFLRAFGQPPQAMRRRVRTE